ncbi:MAG: hypothetical protein J7L96_06325 [Bacteroidales bacterium]|nr:hypothetical protein [Bacteroidales bacterium]
MSIKNYYGSLNEIRYGIRKKALEKPDALKLYEQTNRFSNTLVEGGIMDQPYIFMREWYVCDDETILFQQLEKTNTSVKNALQK